MDVHKSGSYTYIPEPPVTPPAEPQAYTADCNHEITAPDDLELQRGESGGGYEWEGGVICPECAADRADEWWTGLTLKEKMALLKSEFKTLEELTRG